MERSRRSRGGPSKAAESLAKIREARLTGQTAQYDVGEVDGIFEEVDEEKYNDIREKRTDTFVVGDDDRGYYDNGDEFYDNSDEEKNLTKAEKKLKQDVTRKKKFAQGSKNITSMFLASKKKKKTKGINFKFF